MKKIIFHPNAKQDLKNIGNYIAQYNPIRAVTFINEIIFSIKQLSVMPLSGRLQSELNIPNLRAQYFGNYIIFYEPLQDCVHILHVIHGARDIATLFEAPLFETDEDTP
jgi:toxin ParE1/3/4